MFFAAWSFFFLFRRTISNLARLPEKLLNKDQLQDFLLTKLINLYIHVLIYQPPLNRLFTVPRAATIAELIASFPPEKTKQRDLEKQKQQNMTRSLARQRASTASASGSSEDKRPSSRSLASSTEDRRGSPLAAKPALRNSSRGSEVSSDESRRRFSFTSDSEGELPLPGTQQGIGVNLVGLD